jgi:hypothetical protein
MKAIKITDRTIDYLVTKFAVDPLDKNDQFPLGYYVVTDFGNDETFEVLTEGNYLAYLTVTEPELKNGWVGVRLT